MSQVQRYPHWTDLPYAGEQRPPQMNEGVEFESGKWKTYFIKHSQRHGFKKLDGRPIRLAIKDPQSIDWNRELQLVKKAQTNLTAEQKKMAVYWGEGPPSKQWTPIVDRLIDTYHVEAPRAARILGAVFSGMNDAFVVCWSLKYKWLVPRPNQLDPNFSTVICTPKHPSYPSGHATISGAAEAILSYFFPAERRKIKELAEENAISRLYAGVHYPVDNDEGLRLGRQIGRIVVDELKKDHVNGHTLDQPLIEYRNANVYPEDYSQAIPFRFEHQCNSLLLNEDSMEESTSYTEWIDPKLFY
ncbi:vanadium-dependent haloperoxidase [Halobacillus karajensis]|uniref:PAP2 superfamily protein n=1 Tax=Halobacillus karajensis TaxID=195088 RepID=A0A059NYK9_9BACI|nr:vanadium-dependent haloperoxidase [Halobacillus karajensis]CDQ18632.1 PAP2 superfamily protein [Halobacillus karajensis]CDQ23296.1 PAP2 superfamily protein [Halobacillus karajensis]CDQ26778.1 PAP2 superfamily protein [Halobacillus karajensis]